LFRIDVKLGLSYAGKNIDGGCMRTGCRGGFKTCTLLQLLR